MDEDCSCESAEDMQRLERYLDEACDRIRDLEAQVAKLQDQVEQQLPTTFTRPPTTIGAENKSPGSPGGWQGL